jgi:predicted  nucleic acid-binding Zn-ribbon protein
MWYFFRDQESLEATMYTTIEERVANLEGRVEEHTGVWQDIKDMMITQDGRMIGLEQRIDRRFEAIDRRFEAIDKRFEAIDRRFEAIDRRFEAIDRRFEALENRIQAMDAKFTKYFLWIIGFQFSILLTLVAILLK